MVRCQNAFGLLTLTLQWPEFSFSMDDKNRCTTWICYHEILRITELIQFYLPSCLYHQNTYLNSLFVDNILMVFTILQNCVSISGKETKVANEHLTKVCTLLSKIEPSLADIARKLILSKPLIIIIQAIRLHINACWRYQFAPCTNLECSSEELAMKMEVKWTIVIRVKNVVRWCTLFNVSCCSSFVVLLNRIFDTVNSKF